MPRFAVIDNGIVVGVMAASTMPVIDIPPNRIFVDITDGPDVRGGETYDRGVFLLTQPVVDQSLSDRVAVLEKAVATTTK